MLKIQTLAQFPVKNIPYPVIPALVFLLCQFAVFAYYQMNNFISLTYYFPAPYIFLILYYESLVNYFLLLLKEI